MTLRPEHAAQSSPQKKQRIRARVRVFECMAAYRSRSLNADFA
jgi:hypothetical protein